MNTLLPVSTKINFANLFIIVIALVATILITVGAVSFVPFSNDLTVNHYKFTHIFCRFSMDIDSIWNAERKKRASTTQSIENQMKFYSLRKRRHLRRAVDFSTKN